LLSRPATQTSSAEEYGWDLPEKYNVPFFVPISRNQLWESGRFLLIQNHHPAEIAIGFERDILPRFSRETILCPEKLVFGRRWPMLGKLTVVGYSPMPMQFMSTFGDLFTSMRL